MPACGPAQRPSLVREPEQTLMPRGSPRRVATVSWARKLTPTLVIFSALVTGCGAGSGGADITTTQEPGPLEQATGTEPAAGAAAHLVSNEAWISALRIRRTSQHRLATTG
jgi:hypothetical protein